MNKLRYSEMFYSLQGEGRYVGVPSIFLRVFGCNFECRGFGQSRDKSNWLPEEHMPHNREYPDVKSIVDLPVPALGCDSSFSWGKKWGHLANNDSVDEIIDKMNAFGSWYGQKGEVSMALKQDDAVHLVITGGEPLLKGFRSAMSELILHEHLNTNWITFETNGTQKYHFNDVITTHEDYVRYCNKYRREGLTWAVSPKLSISGESWEEAIVPEALLTYNSWPDSYLYLKFVVRDETDIEEVQQAVYEYDNAGVDVKAVYLMPEGAIDSQMNELDVANLALRYGYKYSPRLHLNLFGNKWGT